MINVKVFSKDEELNKELEKLKIKVVESLEMLDDIEVLLIYKELPSGKMTEKLRNDKKKIYVINKNKDLDYKFDGEILMHGNIAMGIKSLVNILEENCQGCNNINEVYNKLTKKNMIITDKIQKLGILKSKLVISRDLDIDLHLNMMGRNLDLSDCENIVDKFNDIKLKSLTYNVSELDFDDNYLSMMITN